MLSIIICGIAYVSFECTNLWCVLAGDKGDAISLLLAGQTPLGYRPVLIAAQLLWQAADVEPAHPAPPFRLLATMLSTPRQRSAAPRVLPQIDEQLIDTLLLHTNRVMAPGAMPRPPSRAL